MANIIFDKFIEEIGSGDPGGDTNRTAMRNEWLQHVEQFFDTIHGFLKPYVDQGKISISFDKTTINEEYIGEYAAKTAIIKMGSRVVKFEPVGANLIGARGRIDMIGPYGSVRFLLVDKDAEAPKFHRGEIHRIKNDTDIVLAWKIATDPPNIKYYAIDEDAFFNALMEVVYA